MRLRRLDLTRYGKFTGHSIDFGPAPDAAPDFHVVYGLNEAGKSTALSGFLDLLFGIEERSRFNFLHPYNTMQLGASLEFDGRQHDLVRVKQRTGSLQDETGRPINEAMLSGALAGLTRDAYRTMFSLDDETLEAGGNAILESKGELGRMLFSASAGLAGVSNILEAIAEEATRIYKKNGRTTRLAELRTSLAELKASRENIDTLASAHAALVAEHGTAAAAYEEALAAQSRMRARQAEVLRLLRALPLNAEHMRTQRLLAEYGDLPRPRPEWTAELPKLLKADTQLTTEMSGAENNRRRIAGELAAIVVDEAILAVDNRIAALEPGRARYSTAETDLPKRRAALLQQETVIRTTLARLQAPSGVLPEALLLPAMLVGTLEDLIEQRSGIDTALALAEREAADALDVLTRAEGQLKVVEANGAGIDDAAFAGLEAALRRVQSGGSVAALAAAERNLRQLTQIFAGELAALQPWAGTGEDLAALLTPSAGQIESWRLEARDGEARVLAAKSRLRELQTQHEESRARLGAFGDSATTIGDTEAQQTRTARNAAWTRHLAQLDAGSAEHFATQMRRDDALTEARLARARDIEQMRQLHEQLTVTDAAIRRQRELLDEAETDLTQLLGSVRSAAPALVFPEARMGAVDAVSQLEDWLRRRDRALTTHRNLAQAERDVSDAQEALGSDKDALVEALAATGPPEHREAGLDALTERARSALAAAVKLRSVWDAAEQAIAERGRELAARERALGAAQAAAARWDVAWQKALSKTWFGADELDVGAAREILKVLGTLPAALQGRDEWVQRIAAMEHDQDHFIGSVQAIATELGETCEAADAFAFSRSLVERLQAARRAHDTRNLKGEELKRLEGELRDLDQQWSRHEAQKGQLLVFFGVETLGEVGDKLQHAADKLRLESRLAEVETQILRELGAPSLELATATLSGVDISTLEAEAAELEARLKDLDGQIQQLFAEQTLAKRRLDSVGGDDAVARIEAQRRTTTLEMEDLALTYLRLRTGALGAEKALRAYRDKHRSSMMNRASDAFRLVTRGDYSGLAAMPRKDSEILIGIPRAGGSRETAEMSKGTQFQLYLALRLAGYQEFSAVRAPVPFIADDIMETFDEPRSEEVFRLFGETAKMGQVIYLTHHRHLCEIAREVVPGVRIHELP